MFPQIPKRVISEETKEEACTFAILVTNEPSVSSSFSHSFAGSTSLETRRGPRNKEKKTKEQTKSKL